MNGVYSSADMLTLTDWPFTIVPWQHWSFAVVACCVHVLNELCLSSVFWVKSRCSSRFTWMNFRWRRLRTGEETQVNATVHILKRDSVLKQALQWLKIADHLWTETSMTTTTLQCNCTRVVELTRTFCAAEDGRWALSCTRPLQRTPCPSLSD